MSSETYQARLSAATAYQVVIREDDTLEGESLDEARERAPVFEHLEHAMKFCEAEAIKEFGEDHENLRHGMLEWFSDYLVVKSYEAFGEDLIAEAEMPASWHCYIFQVNTTET